MNIILCINNGWCVIQEMRHVSELRNWLLVYTDDVNLMTENTYPPNKGIEAIICLLTLSVLKKLWCVLWATWGTLDVEWACAVEVLANTDLSLSFSQSSRLEVLKSEADLERCLLSNPPCCLGSSEPTFRRDLSAGTKQNQQQHTVRPSQLLCLCRGLNDAAAVMARRRFGPQSKCAQYWIT